MKVGSSLRNRHVVARMEMGEDFFECLKKYFLRESVNACFFNGFGEFSKCSLQLFNPEKRMMETVFTTDAFSSVPYIIGNVTRMGNEVVINASCVLNYRVCNQMYSMAGLIQSAKVYNAELHLCIFDDLRLTRTFDAATGMVPISKISSMYDYDEDSYASSSGIFHASSNLNVELQDVNSDVLSISSISSSLQDSGVAAMSEGHSQPQVIRRKSRTNIDDYNELSDPNLSSGITASKSTVKRRKADPGENSAIDQNDQNNVSATQLDSSYEIKAGDWAIHPMSGHCRINAILPNNCIRLEMPSGSLREFSMQLFEFERVENYKGRKCYKMNRVQ